MRLAPFGMQVEAFKRGGWHKLLREALVNGVVMTELFITTVPFIASRHGLHSSHDLCHICRTIDRCVYALEKPGVEWVDQYKVHLTPCTDLDHNPPATTPCSPVDLNSGFFRHLRQLCVWMMYTTLTVAQFQSITLLDNGSSVLARSRFYLLANTSNQLKQLPVPGALRWRESGLIRKLIVQVYFHSSVPSWRNGATFVQNRSSTVCILCLRQILLGF
jgi:hypothetical protein